MFPSLTSSRDVGVSDRVPEGRWWDALRRDCQRNCGTRHGFGRSRAKEGDGGRSKVNILTKQAHGLCYEGPRPRRSRQGACVSSRPTHSTCRRRTRSVPEDAAAVSAGSSSPACLKPSPSSPCRLTTGTATGDGEASSRSSVAPSLSVVCAHHQRPDLAGDEQRRHGCRGASPAIACSISDQESDEAELRHRIPSHGPRPDLPRCNPHPVGNEPHLHLRLQPRQQSYLCSVSASLSFVPTFPSATLILQGPGFESERKVVEVKDDEELVEELKTGHGRKKKANAKQ
ncbi:hypothetical protein ZWY2020_007471 [Hordeum vulgare]|nr:hypothetical protein ZWY2020_007471 [Hordeum vulgare]